MADYSDAYRGDPEPSRPRVIKGEKGDKGDKGDTGATGPMGPPGPASPSPAVITGPAGGSITVTPSAGAGVLHIPPSMGSSAVPPARKPLEHVVLPQRLPRRVLVAFLDEDGNPEPFWAAYLAPQDIVVNMNPLDPQDACMDLRLSLVKVFEQ